MPDQSFQHSATTPAGVDEVWSALELPTTWEAIPGVDRVVDAIVDASGRLLGFSFQSAVGGRRYNGRATPAEREVGRSMGWHITTSEIQGLVSVGLVPEGDATRVEVSLEVEGVGILGSLLFPAIASAIGSGFPDTVEEFVGGLGA